MNTPDLLQESNRRQMLRNLALVAGSFGLGAPLLRAQETPGAHEAPRVTKLFSQELDQHPGESLTLVSLTFPPGAEDRPHRHPGPVLVYVLEGTLELQAGSDPLKTVHAGETFYEATGVVHSVARNPHATQTARAIAFLLGKSDAPLVKPA